MKYIFLIISLFTAFTASAQKPDKHWYHSKPTRSNMGIDLDKAYASEYVKREAKDIVVAVIDGGTDVNHEDLKDVLWVNTKEIPGNGLDDDKNGYIDDVHGWNFIGGPNHTMVGGDNLEITRLVAKWDQDYKDGGDINDASYQFYLKMKEDVQKNRDRALASYNKINKVSEVLTQLKEMLGKENPTAEELENISGDANMITVLGKGIAKMMKQQGTSFKDFEEEIKGQADYFYNKANFHYNTEFNSRMIVQDDYSNSSERYYGNWDVVGPDAGHGTHVAGIIGAKRGNGVGLDGVADHVKIMVVRVVPDGDERDKDVANGIRYAVDMGAQIINMSFGKGYKWDKNIVDSAVAYAESKGVLLVHAAGNNSSNNDIKGNYPNDTLWGGKTFASNWIEIGASQLKKKELATGFSNYGKDNVDIFSPGRDIYSSIPDNKYAYFNGTSMAAPVAAGVAALVWSRYPELTAVQLKEIIMESGKKIRNKVILPGTSDKIRFKELCRSGRLINAYNALKLADEKTK